MNSPTPAQLAVIRKEKQIQRQKRRQIIQQTLSLAEIRKLVSSQLDIRHQLRLWRCRKQWMNESSLAIDKIDHHSYSVYHFILKASLLHHSATYRDEAINILDGKKMDREEYMEKLSVDYIYLRK